jgi:hypothetical protein
VFISILAVCRWFLLPCGNETGALQPICLSRDESKPCIIGYEDFDETYIFVVWKSLVFRCIKWFKYKSPPVKQFLWFLNKIWIIIYLFTVLSSGPIGLFSSTFYPPWFTNLFSSWNNTFSDVLFLMQEHSTSGLSRDVNSNTFATGDMASCLVHFFTSLAGINQFLRFCVQG